MSKIRVVVQVEGGLVTSVHADGDVEVEVVDWDNFEAEMSGKQYAKERERVEKSIEGMKEVW